MFNGDCYPNGSYINEISITPTSKLQCVLPNSTLSGEQWIDPGGQPVNCDINNNNVVLKCDTTDNPASISLYRPNSDISFNELDASDNERH